MKIEIPSLAEQQKIVLADAVRKNIDLLKANLEVSIYPPQKEIDESKYDNSHLLDKYRYQSPHPDIVGAYFRHFQMYFPEYKTDKLLANLLGVSSDRRIREFKQGKNKVPYEVWDKFLVMTGRKPQSVITVLGLMGG